MTSRTLAVFLFGTLWAIFYAWHTGLLYDKPIAEEKDIAVHLARGEGFRSPFDDVPNATPTSWSPPVYPALMSVVFRVWGIETRAASVVLQCLNAICFGAVAAGLFALGGRLFWPAAGLFSAGLFLVHPMFLRCATLIWDHELSLAMFIWLVVAAIHIRGRGKATMPLAGLGLGLAVLCLTNASYLLTVPVIGCIAAAGSGWRLGTRAIAITSLAFVLGLAPWTIRNAVTFHRFYFVRGGGSFELFFGNRPEMTGWVRRDLFDIHPAGNEKEQDMILADEPGYFDLCAARFARQRRDDPAGFRRRCVNRFVYLFLSDPTEKEYYAFMPNWKWHGYVIDRVFVNGFLAAFGLSGIYAAIRLNFKGIWLLALLLAAGAPFVIAHVWDRYTLPLRAMLLVGTGFLFALLLRRRRCGLWESTAGCGFQPFHLSTGRPPIRLGGAAIP